MPKTRIPKRLRQYAIRLKRLPDGHHLDFDVCDGAVIGLRSKLGGDPDWLQGEATPKCKHCGKRMSFIGQIDSVEHDVGKNPHRRPFREQEFVFGDVGFIYVFFCFRCLHPAAVFQCY